jgi:FkbM family methyltransferase
MALTTHYFGKPFVYPLGSVIGRRLERGQEWDSFLQAILPVLVEEEEPTICEVGSNIGASLMQVLAAKPRARVLAFEPSDHFRSYLLRNIGFAGVSDRVRVYPYLAGSEAGAKELFHNASTASAVIGSYEGPELSGTQLVETVTLDAILAGERVHFIKVDTDGFEFEVLQGATSTLREWRPSLHLEFSTLLIPEPLRNLAWLQRLGYKRLLCLTPLGDFIGVTEDPSQAVKWAQDGEALYCDIVTCFEGSEAEARLLSTRHLLSLRLRARKERFRRRRFRLRRGIDRQRRHPKIKRVPREIKRLRRGVAYRLVANRRGDRRLWWRMIRSLWRAMFPSHKQ